MSKNLLKASWVNVDSSEKRVIDADALYEHIVGRSGIGEVYAFDNFDGADDLEDNPDQEQINALLGEDADTVEDEVGEAGQKPVYSGPTPEELIEQAQREIDAMKEAAQTEIEEIKQKAFEEASSQGKQAGYDDGYQAGRMAVEAELARAQETERLLREEYSKSMDNLEPLFVNTLTEIYEHVFKVDLSENREIIMHLLNTALHNIESGKDFIIRVSKEDYPFVSMQKKKLVAGISGAVVEVVEDLTLKKGDCLIETGGGIFDCSVDVELFTLGKRLRLLAENGEKGNA